MYQHVPLHFGDAPFWLVYALAAGNTCYMRHAACGMVLEAGRHLCRIFCCSPNSFVDCNCYYCYSKWVYKQVDAVCCCFNSVPPHLHRRTTAAFRHRFRQFIISRLSLAISRPYAGVVFVFVFGFGFGFAVNALNCIDLFPFLCALRLLV